MMNGYYSHAATAPGPECELLVETEGRLSGRMGEKRVRGGRGSASPLAISTSGRRRRASLRGRGEKNMREREVQRTQAACLDLKRKEAREEILAGRRVDVCSLRRPQQHCDCSVAARTLGR